MRQLVVTAVVAVLGVVGPAAPAAATPVRPEIAGGAMPQWATPWAALVMVDELPHCSGTIIAARWVLTAAHCLDGTAASRVSVRVGHAQWPRGQAEGAQRVHIHPDYLPWIPGREEGEVTPPWVTTPDAGGEIADVALVELRNGVETRYARIGGSVKPGQPVSMYGWGATASGASPQHIRYARGVVEYAYGPHIGVQQAGPDVKTAGMMRSGDSGGPIFANGRQVAVASGSAEADGYGARLALYRGWLEQKVGAPLC